jgi:replicative DNA helicase
LINHVLKTKDIVSPLNADVDRSFLLYGEEWEFIKEYYIKHREVPPATVFQNKFDDWDLYNTDGAIEFYIEELHKWKAKHVLQEIITGAASNLKDQGPFSTITRMQHELAKLGRDTRMVRDLDLVGNAEERIENLRERVMLRASGKSLIGIPSGVQALDEAFGGWQKGDFVVIAGWTGSLKSWLAMHFALNAWKEGYRVLYFSLEMSGLQIGYRFDTMLSGMYGEDFTNSGLTHAIDITYDKYKNWLGEIMRDKHPFVVVTNEDLDEVTQNTVSAKIEQWKPDLVILDYHGLFDDASGAMGETEKAKNLSKAFKRIAIKTGTPIIDITGVTMTGDHGERPPELNEMAWTKQLAYDSDLTLAVCFNKESEVLEVVSRKTRRGKDFRFWLDWDVDRGIVRERSKAANSVFGLEESDDEDGDSED